MGIKFTEGPVTSQSRLTSSLRNSITRSLERRRKIISGVLVEVEGSVKVAGRPGFVWVREYAKSTATYGGVWQVFCPGNACEIRQNMPVFVGPSPKDPYRLEVLGVNWSVLCGCDTYTGDNYVLGPHGKSHTFLPGMPDPLWSTDVADITTRNLRDGRVYPTTPASMKCLVATCQYFNKAGDFKIFQRSYTKDFTADVPGVGLARLVYICIDGDTNSLAYVNSSTFSWLSYADPVPPTALSDIPDAYVLLSAVILHNGMTTITESEFRYEVRPIFRTVAAAAGLLLNHDHSGDAGDGGTFDAANLASGASGDGTVLTSDGAGGAAWESIPTQATQNHDHSGDAGDGGAFDATNLTSGAATDGYVLTADGAGGAAWEAAAGVGAHNLLSASHTDTDAAAIPADGDAVIRRSGEWVSEAPVDIASDAADITAVNLTEGTKPTAPGAGHRLIYAKAGGVYEQDSTGTETQIGGVDTSLYQLRSEKGASSGYAELDGSALVPVDQLGTGTPDGTKYLRDDRTWTAVLGRGELLVQDGSSAPPVTLTNEAEDDWLYEG